MQPTTWFLLLAGLALLFAGGEALVRGAAALARWGGISPLVVGVTIVAFGTSSPEVLVSLQAALAGNAEISLGNVVGSNIFNILGILGLAGLLHPVAMNPGLLRLEIPVMLLASILLAPILATGLRIGRTEGALLLAGYTVFTVVLVVRGA